MAAHLSSPYIVFVGLGNPGIAYERTRHNLGYLVISSFAKKMEWTFKADKQFQANVAKGVVNGIVVHLLLPITYMNKSGEAIRSYLNFFKLESSKIVIVVDDIAFPFGELRLKTSGSAGGHNGLKSIENHLITTHYVRLRMGIGHPGGQDLADYVLSSFNKEELENLEIVINRGVEVLQRLLRESVSHVMKTVNSISPKAKQMLD